MSPSDRDMDLAELADTAIGILRKELGEACQDLFLIQTHWLTERCEWRISVWVTFRCRFVWQSNDWDGVLEDFVADVWRVKQCVRTMIVAGGSGR